jgi:lipopolysaccharide/colanic/teichoic acid biosynthesis glycosyltransferase
MTSIGRIARWLRGASRGPALDDEYLLPVLAMRRMLHRERLRSDRSGASFSLLVLTFMGEAKFLARALEFRLRATDAAGYLLPDQIGVFLPDTPPAGAWKVVEDLLQLLPAKQVSPDCEVFVYPHSWRTELGEGLLHEVPVFSGDRNSYDGNDYGGNGHGHPVAVAQENGHAGERPHAGQGHVAHFASQRAHGHESGKQKCLPHVRARHVHPLHTAFAQPLPWWKRAIDILGAAAGLLLLSPVLLAAGVAVKLTSRGPALFIQPREGLGGQRFRMLKFRTMIDGAAALQQGLMKQNEQDGPAFKITDDPRVTRVGKKLRDWNIDELPQLWNVLRGEMSLVGPRPLPVQESIACKQWQRRRLDVTPGMTCLWQVRDRRNTIPFPEWMRLDLAYANRRTLRGDLRLLWETFTAMFVRRFFQKK